MKIKKVLCFVLAAAMLLPGTMTMKSYATNDGEETVVSDEIESIERTDVETSTREVSFFIDKAGEYTFKTEYRLKSYNSSKVSIDVTVDGKTAFAEASLVLPVYWKMSGNIKQDANGNDVRPSMEAAGIWMNYTALDGNDFSQMSPCYYLERGEHTAVFVFNGADVELRNTEFYIEQELPNYEEYLKEHQDTERYNGAAVVLQAENFWLTNSRFITPQNENGNPCTIPADPYALRLNTVGGSSWQQTGEELIWNLEHVITQEGMYFISARYMQNYSSGLEVYRTITVNGEVPFQEAKAIAFQYEDSWQSESLGYYFYLKPGDKLGLRATIGKSNEISKAISDSVSKLNQLYSKITVITGTSPDEYFDYDIVGQLPEFVDFVNDSVESISLLVELLEERYDATEAGFTCLYGAKRLLKKVAEKPRYITQSGNLSTLKSYISEMGTLVTNIKNQPLLLDSISFMSKESQVQRANPGFFQSLIYRVKRVIASYQNDYSMVSGESQGESIKVWVSTGRDQASIINEMILQEFTPETGISVDLELVQTSLISANFAGTAPDVVLQQGSDAAVNFAMRNALVDLSEYEGFEELKEDYIADAFLPFVYEEGCYGLPETMTFSMLFYRTDIFDEMSLEVPVTWEQVVNETLPALSWYGKEFGIAQLAAGTTLFQNLLYQNGGNLYSVDYRTTALNTEEAFEAIQFGTKLYTEYDCPQSYDSMSRFRSGEMPILIESYSFYNSLAYTCPELDGCWEMVVLPGTLREDGTVDNCQAAGITGCFMFESSENKTAAWEFMKWWTSAETQLEFGIKQETILGASGRYTPANLETLQQLPWTSAQLRSIQEQIDTLFCIPEIPGSYYITRCLNNAFQNTVISGKNAREQLITWNAQINMELERKREEFDYVPAFE